MLQSAEEIATAAVLAALLEASAAKPGNVSPTRDFHDTRYEHFLASAAALGPAFRTVGEQSLGVTIHRAVVACRSWSPVNTNLGIILLLAPLAHAAMMSAEDTTSVEGTERRALIRDRLRLILAEATVDDARLTYEAIRLAAPAGLGQVKDQDVNIEPSVKLLDTMSLAAGRDAVAHEYATTFELTFEINAPALLQALTDGLPWSDAIVECFLLILSRQPDSLIARKIGFAAAEDIQATARRVVELGGIRTTAGRAEIAALDRGLRDPRNLRNPGTTADLTAAAIYVLLLEGRWAAASARRRS